VLQPADQLGERLRAVFLSAPESCHKLLQYRSVTGRPQAGQPNSHSTCKAS
jgi:hypothetical protein